MISDMKNSERRNGFALIELMIIVAILSLAAALLVPHFLKEATPPPVKNTSPGE
jgi:prepilin-type N-terminal cleavage/methylation domain-containing protein